MAALFQILHFKITLLFYYVPLIHEDHSSWTRLCSILYNYGPKWLCVVNLSRFFFWCLAVGTLIALKSPYPCRVEEPSIYESVLVHTAMQSGRSSIDLVPCAPAVTILWSTSKIRSSSLWLERNGWMKLFSEAQFSQEICKNVHKTTDCLYFISMERLVWIWTPSCLLARHQRGLPVQKRQISEGTSSPCHVIVRFIASWL